MLWSVHLVTRRSVQEVRRERSKSGIKTSTGITNLQSEESFLSSLVRSHLRCRPSPGPNPAVVIQMVRQTPPAVRNMLTPDMGRDTEPRLEYWRWDTRPETAKCGALQSFLLLTLWRMVRMMRGRMLTRVQAETESQDFVR